MDVRLPRVAAIGVLAGFVALSGLAQVWVSETAAAPATVGPATEVVPDTVPVVTRVGRSPIRPSREPRVLTVVGTGFSAGMTVRLVTPLETEVVTFPAAALERLTPTSFELRVTLEVAGVYQLTVRSPSGQRSASVAVTVKGS
jgi:hypothetical protein